MRRPCVKTSSKIFRPRRISYFRRVCRTAGVPLRCGGLLLLLVADGKLVAADFAPVRENLTAIFRFHPFPETVLVFPFSVARLKRPLHDWKSLLPWVADKNRGLSKQ